MMQRVNDVDMMRAMGPLYSPSVDLPPVSYETLTDIECELELENARSDLDARDLSVSGPERETSWSDSWAAVRDSFAKSEYELAVLDPPYVSASPIVRWMGRYARASTGGFEMEVYKYIRETVFRKLMLDASTVHDIGSGSCFNSAAYCRLNSAVDVVAYDWAPASQDIANMLHEQHGMRVRGERLNLYDSKFTLGSNDIVMTTCALEQLGHKWESFLDNALREKPKRVVHIEPILEKYSDNIFDGIARAYHVRRNYLNGYYSELIRLQNAGQIDLICDHRTGIGSRFHECYTILAWEPL